MKKLFLLAALCCLAFVACKKDDVATDPNGHGDNGGRNDNASLAAYVGEYDMVIVCDSLSTDDEWFSNEYYGQITGEPEEDMYGTLTLTLSEDGSCLNVLGTIDFEGQDPVPYYVTTATLDAEGRLVMAPGSVLSESGYTFNTTYRLPSSTSPLVFTTETHVSLAGYDFGYIQTNTCTKR